MANLRIAQYALTLGLLMLGVAAMIPKPNPSAAWIAARNGSPAHPLTAPNPAAETMIAERTDDDARYRTSPGEDDQQPPSMQIAIRPERVEVESPKVPLNGTEAAVPMPIDLPPRQP
ncbi:hypothetical protein [Thalassoroseus pseudoceratinae]|uniref:hypothetical protein n=1 Tax=Thalassoroseus pseudoceratinae TaxID=2713176 RepID=UPI00141E87C6|nr:hypothetical protein [Thalassoroseus pseudoceratinae]